MCNTVVKGCNWVLHKLRTVGCQCVQVGDRLWLKYALQHDTALTV